MTQGEATTGRIGRYELQRQLGTGGMGAVHLARDPDLQRFVAIKLLHANLAATPGARERFRREARSLAALNHPGIVTIHEIGEHDGADFIVMEYLQGRDLAATLSEGEHVVQDLLGLVARVARAVAAAHDAEVLHRDIKPANVMVLESGAVKVVDFGLAHRLSEPGMETPAAAPLVTSDAGSVAQALTRTLPAQVAESATAATRTVFGTPAYMAPELLTGSAASPASDAYSFGVMLYEIIAGGPPYREESLLKTLQAILNPERIPARLDDLGVADKDLADLVAGLLSRDPEQRPTLNDAAGVLEVMAGHTPQQLPLPVLAKARAATSRVIESQPTLAASVPELQPPSPGERRMVWVLGALVLGALATGIAYYWNVDGRETAPLETASAAPAPAPTVLVAVPPLEASVTMTEAFAPGSDAMSWLLGAVLTRVEGIDVVDARTLRYAVGEAGPTDDAWVVAARAHKATHVIRGRVDEIDRHLKARATLVNLATNGVVATVEATAAPDSLDLLVGDLGAALAPHLVAGAVVDEGGVRRSVAALEAYELGFRELHNANWSGAILYLERTVKEAPDFADAWYRLALAFEWSNAPPEKSRGAIDKALALAKGERSEVLYKAFERRMAGDFDAAIAMLRPAWERWPRDQDIGYELGEALYHTGHHRDGIAVFEEVLEMAPHHSPSGLHPMLHYRAHKNPEKAREHRALVHKGAVGMVNAENALLMAMGRYDEILAKEGLSPSLRVNLLALSGRHKEARALLDEIFHPGVRGTRHHYVAYGLRDDDEALVVEHADAIMDYAEANVGLPNNDIQLGRLGAILVAGHRERELERVVAYWEGKEIERNHDPWRVFMHAAPILGRPELLELEVRDYWRRTSIEALKAELADDLDGAIAAWQKLLADAGPYGDVYEVAALQRVLRKAARTEELKALCAELRTPVSFSPAWLVLTGNCERWGLTPKP